MKERPINLKTWEVLAIFQGRKTQLRRVVKPQPSNSHLFQGWVLDSTCGQDVGKAAWAIGNGPLMQDVVRVSCPFGQVGDKLWVRETWKTAKKLDARKPSEFAGWPVNYVADYALGTILGDTSGVRRSASHMPREASRILLEVANVRVERLRDISEADAIAEGSYLDRCACLPRSKDRTPMHAAFKLETCHIHGSEFSHLWESINGVGSWDDNPWVWVIEFKRIDKKGGAE